MLEIILITALPGLICAFSTFVVNWAYRGKNRNIVSTSIVLSFIIIMWLGRLTPIFINSYAKYSVFDLPFSYKMYIIGFPLTLLIWVLYARNITKDSNWNE